MKISLVYPGPDWSVRDVARGYHHALATLGHDVRPVDLPQRIRWFEVAMKTISPKQAEQEHILRLASEMAVAEIVGHKPDVALIISGMYIHPNLVVCCRNAGIKTAILLTECPYDDESQLIWAKLCDYVFVNDKVSVEPFRKVNPHTWYLPHAYDPDIHRPILIREEERCDVFFVGTGFGGRVELLEAVDWAGIDLVLRGYWELAEGSPLQPFYRGGMLANEEAARYYSGAKISLNLHRVDTGWGLAGGRPRIAEAYSLNPRAFEVPACAGFQLCDDSRPELAEIFGDTVATFHDAKDLDWQIRYWLDPRQDAERARRAQAARQCVTAHIFLSRATELTTRLQNT